MLSQSRCHVASGCFWMSPISIRGPSPAYCQLVPAHFCQKFSQPANSSRLGMKNSETIGRFFRCSSGRSQLASCGSGMLGCHVQTNILFNCHCQQTPASSLYLSLSYRLPVQGSYHQRGSTTFHDPPTVCEPFYVDSTKSST